MDYSLQTEQEMDGRWLAEVPELPGVLAYGATSQEAAVKAESLALRVIADRLEAMIAVWLSLVLPVTMLTPAQVAAPAHHLRHLELFGDSAPAINRAVLAGVDRVQATAMDGGGYFIGVHAKPAESPLGYPLRLGDIPMLTPTRTTSYCSGSSYGALVEALSQVLGPRLTDLSADRVEAMRMQEPDGGRRDDGVKAWGWWNADGWGCDYCLVQYLGIGDRVAPMEALPGDFMNISWRSGLGHSVVFLGWGVDAAGHKGVRYWSSQTGTNGFGDQFSPLTKIVSVVDVRLSHPERLFTFDRNANVTPKFPGDLVSW